MKPHIKYTNGFYIVTNTSKFPWQDIFDCQTELFAALHWCSEQNDKNYRHYQRYMTFA